jgi:hypothetical protein
MSPRPRDPFFSDNLPTIPTPPMDLRLERLVLVLYIDTMGGDDP